MHSAKILLVGDYAPFRRLLEQIVTSEDAQVVVAESGREALAACERAWPDLVILAVGLSLEDAFATCRRLRQCSHVPIIVLSTFGQSEHVIKALTCGADDYITCPLDLAVLRARVRALLRRAAPAKARPHQA